MMSSIENWHIILIIGLIVYFLFTLYFQIKIAKSPLLNPKQKRLNSIMIWLVPFLWYLLIKSLITPPKPISFKERKQHQDPFTGGGCAGCGGCGGD